jgi:hypothetical protein
MTNTVESKGRENEMWKKCTETGSLLEGALFPPSNVSLVRGPHVLLIDLEFVILSPE